jgi:hypothetical protein
MFLHDKNVEECQAYYFFTIFAPIFTGVLMGFRLCVKVKIYKAGF